ncbi:MAG TPA: SRPBCC family protein [Candidatus Limnocylindrales bacterium]|nr:SRPBCC family protein [Candidatus Limnocylindrales bacterium]
MSATKIDAPAGVPFIDITREFDAPRDLVYRAYTDPELLVQWLGPRKYKMTIESWEPRDGGKWRFIHSDDNGNAWSFHGVFHGEQTPDGMLQTWEFEGAPGHVSLEKLVLEEHDGKTTVRNHAVYQSIEARDAMIESGMEGGVNEGFERLEELLAQLAPAAVR